MKLMFFGHACALLTNGEVWCWGQNDWGQLGNGEVTPYEWYPTEEFCRPSMVAGVDNAIAIGTTGGHTCALTAAGTVLCWGHPCMVGEPCDPDASNVTSPRRVSLSNGEELSNVVELTANGLRTCGLTHDGHAYCWGLGACHYNPSDPNRGLPEGLEVKNISAVYPGSKSLCVRSTDGRVLCRGKNDTGALGVGYVSPEESKCVEEFTETLW